MKSILPHINLKVRMPGEHRGERWLRLDLPAVLLLILLSAPVAPVGAAEYHVATTGQDSNPGTAARPFSTIQKAADLLVAGDTCVIHGGSYRESVVMKSSGAVASPIRLVSAPGETVVIDGTETPDFNWTKFRGDIYRAPIGISFRQLFFDEAMMFEARWPNMCSLDDLWKESRWAVVGPGSEYGRIVDPALAATGIDMTGTTAVLNVYHQFYTWTRPVKEHRAGGDSFTYEKNLREVKEAKDETGSVPSFTDDRYYLVGKLDLLDVPGEWYLDGAGGFLYFYAPGGADPTGHRIAVKQRDYGFTASGQHHIQIDGLTFFGCGIKLDQCDDCRLENSSVLYASCTEQERLSHDDPNRNLEFLHPEVTGNRNVIRNNVFAYGTQTGLFVDGTDDLIENNIFHDFGWLASLAHVALRFSKSWAKPAPGTNCLIRYNTLYNTGGPVLHFNGRNITIEYNDIFHGMRAAFGGNKDVAMLYTQSDVTGSKARCNWVHDSAGGSTDNTWGNGIGIRGDDKTAGFTVERNVIWHLGACSIMMKNVEDPTQEQANAIVHNTTFDNSTMLLGKSRVDVILAMNKGGENKLSLLRNNAANQLSSGWGGRPLPESPNISNNFVGGKLPLIDPENCDFRPSPGSPLIAEGKAPDIGAYESDDDDYWIPGHRTAATSHPIIPDLATGIRLDADLIWLPGYESVSNDIFFGTSREAVESAGRDCREFQGNQRGNVFRPGALSGDTSYYWRIDAVGEGSQVVKGPVWSFHTQ